MTVKEAIKILDNASNSIKESSELGQALEIALVNLEKRIRIDDILERLQDELELSGKEKEQTKK